MGCCALTLAASVSLAGPASATQSAQRIVFSRQLAGGGSDTYTFGPAGRHLHRVDIPLTGEDFGRAVVSHDGRRLLFSNIPYTDPTTGAFVGFRPATSDIDGSRFHVLVLRHRGIDMFCSAWTPDDQRIVCSDDSPAMFTLRAADGGGQAYLSRNPVGGSDVAVGYSPDGKKLAFLRSNSAEQVALVVANADGSHAHRLTPFGLLQGDVFGSANWSPDGKSLISSLSDGHLIVLGADGSEATIIYLQIGTTDYFAVDPDFSPDGQHIVFSAFVHQEADLYRANVDGSHVIQLTNTPENELSPDWAVVHL
jgi:Tol biopolymer transport system component